MNVPIRRPRSALLLVSAALGLLVAILSAYSALASARVVEVVGVFAGAFGAGATLVQAVHEHRGRAAEDSGSA